MEIRELSLNVAGKILSSMVDSVSGIKGIGKQDFLKRFEAFHTMPNLEEISAHFQTQIEQHKQEIIIIEATRQVSDVY